MTTELKIQLMKFAEAELSRGEEAELLTHCEMEPTLYRDLALAFVEERRLQDTLTLAPSTLAPSTLRPATVRTTRRYGSWSLATAAAIAFVCGIATSGMFDKTVQPDAVAGVEEPKGDTFVYIEPHRTPSGSTVHHVSNISPQARQVVAQSLRPWFHPAEYEALKAAGYELKEEPELYVFGDGQGNEAVLPRRNLTITRVSGP